VKLTDFLRILSQPGRINYFVVCPDQLGLGSNLQRALKLTTDPIDLHFFNAREVTVEKARQIEVESRYAPRAGSNFVVFYIYGLQNLSINSVGPLLKTIEEAEYARWIFQAQFTPRKIHTIMSRCSVVKLPFMARDIALANMKDLNEDAQTADEMNLWDGTLDGTIQALGMKRQLIEIKRDLRRGSQGLASLLKEEILNGLALPHATYEFTTLREKAFLEREDTEEHTVARKKLVLYLLCQRADYG